ncbi:MAG TPA: AF1514 family protein [Gallionella sp.]|nr:AF1514 family protein [Gallionella sp.]
MKIHRIVSTGYPLDFDAAIKSASAIADDLIGENMLLSWYDREQDLESPAHVSECHEGSPLRGYWDYASNRGATLAVDFDDGRFVFCFRPMGEFVLPK